ncbi:MAG: HPr(Ser) kinase/phosphatase [Gammaproteobacteria bacterium]|nr:MAG: HPr(Ser) kinase/phosphatase [Gammaproteobacteria bacterium]
MEDSPFEKLYQALSRRIELKWLAGHPPKGPAILPKGPSIGLFNPIHPHPIQILDKPILDYLERDEGAGLLEQNPLLVVVADGLQAPSWLRRGAEGQGIALWSSPLPSHQIIDEMRHVLTYQQAETLTIPGVFMEVMGIGVLLTGQSGVGKSELALELINRGQRLIADDATELIRVFPDTLEGRCPPLLKDFLEVRGLGVLNIRAMFGDNAVKPRKYLSLIVHLLPVETSGEPDRLKGSRHHRTLLGVRIPVVNLPVAPGRNLAVLVEGAVRDHLLRMKGYDAAEDFILRQERHLQGRSP